MNPKIAAGIVLYNPELSRLEQNLKHISPQVDHLYLADNGSENLSAVQDFLSSFKKVSLIPLGENKGIAAALNACMEMAEKDGFEWVITLDQDSVCEENLVGAYLSQIEQKNVAIFTPVILYEKKGESLSLPEFKEPFTEVERCITSAGMTSVKAWKEIGGFDERLFIDYVDYDFCIRLKKCGYRILRVNSVCLHQQLGRADEVDFLENLGKLLHIKRLQKKIYVYNHSPMRTYYYARNSAYYIRKYAEDLSDLQGEKHEVKHWLMMKVLFEKQKCAKIRAIVRGRRDSKKL